MFESVFPARAGMSPVAPRYSRRESRFPRASGDEPSLATRETPHFWFSPRERG